MRTMYQHPGPFDESSAERERGSGQRLCPASLLRQEAGHICGWLGLWRRTPWTWAWSLDLTPSGSQK